MDNNVIDNPSIHHQSQHISDGGPAYRCRVENEDREVDQTLLTALQAFAPYTIGTNWGVAMHPALIGNVGKYRRYDYTSLRDLLRLVRNKRSHYRELPPSLQRTLGPIPDGYLR